MMLRYNSTSRPNNEDAENVDLYDTKLFRIDPISKINIENYDRVI